MYRRVTEEAYECNVSVSASEFKEGCPEGGFGACPVVQERSFFRLEGGHGVLETCKPAFDRADGVVVRLYESKGCAGTAILSVPERVRQVFDCNMLEEQRQELELREGKVRLVFRGFEIKTLLLVVSGD